MSLSAGLSLSNRYRLTRHIATGGMGAVWEADDTVLDRSVAVKILKTEYSADREFVERFRAEALTTARISHPGVATVYDYGQIVDPDTQVALSYLVMELVAGEPLSDVLVRQPKLPLRHTLDMLEQTARALNAAHAIGLVHRDVKPGNILITPSGQVKLTDFGIAKTMGATALTQTGMVVGTAQYIAPEQAMCEDPTPAADVYSLAVVGYECLAGRRPFYADSAVALAMKHIREQPEQLPDTVPTQVRRLLDIAMDKNPRHRFADGAEFAEAIAAVRSGHEPPRPGPTDTPREATKVLTRTAVPPVPASGTGPRPTRIHTPPPSPRPAQRPAYSPQEVAQPRPVARPQQAVTPRVAAPPQRVTPHHGRPAAVAPPVRRSGCGCGCLTWLLFIIIALVAAAVLAVYLLVRSGYSEYGDIMRFLESLLMSSANSNDAPVPQAPQYWPESQVPPTPTAEAPAAPVESPALGEQLDSLLNSFTSEFDPDGAPTPSNAPVEVPTAGALQNGEQ